MLHHPPLLSVMVMLSNLAALLVTLAVIPTVFASRAACEGFEIAQNSTDFDLKFKVYYPLGMRVDVASLRGGAFNDTATDSFCRLAFAISTNATAGSSADMEVWLPDHWNGRTLGVGNGGWGGGIVFPSLGYDGVNNGFSSFSTNLGHNGTGFQGTFLSNNPNGLIDWADRAFHLSTVIAKAVTTQYYRRGLAKSYYLGCSTGGRMGLTAAQRFPEDFDGIVVGSPAILQANSAMALVALNLLVQPVGGPTWISADLWAIIGKEIVKQCDGIDGLLDGVLSDPRNCQFRPESLTCRLGTNSSQCLTIPQIATLKKIYSPYAGGATTSTLDTLLYPGFEPGGESAFSNPMSGLFGETPFPVTVDYWKYAVYNDPNWDYRTIDFSSYELAKSINPGGLDASTNITAFLNRGGKVLHYVGWGDGIIAPGLSINFYESIVAQTLQYSNKDPDEFYRLYTVPGMLHCAGGPGANGFGGAYQRPTSPPLVSKDPRYDVLAAMQEWVEKDIAPQTLIATKYVDDIVSQGVQFTRPICVYPKQAYYTKGNSTDASSFECR